MTPIFVILLSSLTWILSVWKSRAYFQFEVTSPWIRGGKCRTKICIYSVNICFVPRAKTNALRGLYLPKIERKFDFHFLSKSLMVMMATDFLWSVRVLFQAWMSSHGGEACRSWWKEFIGVINDFLWIRNCGQRRNCHQFISSSTLI